MRLVSGCQWSWRTWQAALVSLNSQIFFIRLFVFLFLNVHLLTKYQLTDVFKLLSLSNGHFSLPIGNRSCFLSYMYHCVQTRKTEVVQRRASFCKSLYNILYLALVFYQRLFSLVSKSFCNWKNATTSFSKHEEREVAINKLQMLLHFQLQPQVLTIGMKEQAKEKIGDVYYDIFKHMVSCSSGITTKKEWDY